MAGVTILKRRMMTLTGQEQGLGPRQMTLAPRSTIQEEQVGIMQILCILVIYTVFLYYFTVRAIFGTQFQHVTGRIDFIAFAYIIILANILSNTS